LRSLIEELLRRSRPAGLMIKHKAQPMMAAK
jgi:hypothetical protein